MSNSLHDISLIKLADVERLSVRATNVCKSINLHTLSEILKYYQEKGSFKDVKNCGRRTAEELEVLCKKYKKISTEVVKDNTISNINNLNPKKISIVKKHADFLISNLSIRAKNCIISLEPESDTLKLIGVILQPDFDFYRVRNAGEKTVKELEELKKRVQDLILQIKFLEDVKISIEYGKLLIKTTISQYGLYDENIIDRIIDQNGKVKLFQLMYILLESNEIVKPYEKKIFAEIFFENEEISRFQKEKKPGITKERIRQLKIRLKEDLKNRLNFLTNFNSEDFSYCEIESDKLYITIDSNYVSKINKAEKVNFNKHFIQIIFSLLWNKTHTPLNKKSAKKRGRKKSPDLKGYYLIRNDVYQAFQFEEFLEIIEMHSSGKIRETFELNFLGLLATFMKNDEKKLITEISSVCENIILEEFDLIVNGNGNLIFRKNIKSKLHEYLVEILESRGEKMRVQDIFKVLCEKYPDEEKNENIVRSTLQKNKSLFIFFGRSSTYGLKKWEEENESVRGGTIRDIAEEYLKNENEPKHISEVFQYVSKYRKTNQINVMTNLGLEQNSRFVFFDGNYIGLKTKKYELEVLNYRKVNGVHFMKSMLSRFNNQKIDVIIEQYVKKYKYTSAQVKNILYQKIETGLIKITKDNKISI